MEYRNNNFDKKAPGSGTNPYKPRYDDRGKGDTPQTNTDRPRYDNNRSNNETGSNPYRPRYDNRGSNEQGGYRPRGEGNGKFQQRKPGSAPPKSSERQKTETQDFLMFGEEKVNTLFPVPVNTSLPQFQRALGMAEGTIIEANEKGNGVIEIEGFKYPMKENRTVVMQKRYPLSKYVGKTVKFSFYPTITLKGIKILKLEADDPPFIKIANFRKELAKQGAVEALGTIKSINKDYFTVAIWSATSKKEYVIIIFGRCTAKIGDFVKVDSVLKEGLIHSESIRILENKI